MVAHIFSGFRMKCNTNLFNLKPICSVLLISNIGFSVWSISMRQFYTFATFG